MSKKIIIDASRGGDDIGNSANDIIEKDFNLEISKYIYNRLKDLGIDAFITRSDDSTIDIDERIKEIKNFNGTFDDTIIISNALKGDDGGSEIVYALRNSSGLSEYLASELSKVGIPFNKYYQRRLPLDTNKDYNKIIRDTSNGQSIIIYYGNVLDSTDYKYLKNNLNDLGEAVVIGLLEYLKIPYTPNSSLYYTVKKGDTLYSIAKRYNTTVSEIVNLNKLGSTNLSIGQVLKIPDNDISDNFIYTVKKGDTLYSIAKRYNTTVSEIVNLNKLGSTNLSINQVLKIPSSDISNYLVYTVKKGDTLYSIAKRYNTTVDIIKNYNNLSSNLLSIDQIIKIPTI